MVRSRSVMNSCLMNGCGLLVALWVAVSTARSEQMIELSSAQKSDYDLTQFLNNVEEDAGTQNSVDALPMVEKALADHPDNTELLFAKAAIHWQRKEHIPALETYDHILTLRPGNKAAINLKARLISDMGCCSLALEFAESHRPLIDLKVRIYLKNNMAAARIRWKEPHLATNLLDRLIAGESKESDRERSKFDRILALRDMKRMEEVVDSYNQLLENNITVPYWVDEAAGDAYLYLKQPVEAIKLYRKVVESQPDLFNPQMALYYAYVETGQYGAAREILEQMEGRVPEWIVLRYNWDRELLLAEKGWWLTYQDRLSEAGEYFRSMLEESPANLALRAGLGHVHLWRGWPRLALEDFDVAITMGGEHGPDTPNFLDERDISSKNGRVSAVNESYYKQEARAFGSALLTRNPRNLHTQRINRKLDIEDSTEFFLDALWTEEDPGVDEYYVLTKLTQPITPVFDVYAFWLRRRTSGTNAAIDHNRIGAGADWIFLPSFTLKGEYSRETDTSEDDGFLTRLTYRAGDFWRFDLGYNTFSLDVPIRARARDIDAEMTDFNAVYRSSELFSLRGSAGVQEMSDGNEYYSYGLFGERGLITRSKVKTRLFLEVMGSENTETNVLYFSPDHDFTAGMSHMIEHTIHRRYDHAFVHRLYLGAGRYDQARFDPEFTWFARYEHDYLISDWTVLLWGVAFERSFYDGEDTDVLTWYLTVRKNL